MKHALRAKRIYEPADRRDGQRVLVDRIWPRGMSKDKAALALWLNDIAPSRELLKWFGHKAERWPEFQRRYRAELDHNHKAVEQLIAMLERGDVTLLYGARDT